MAKKGADSVKGGIGLVRKFKIFYVYDKDFEYEYDNYEWEIIKGVNLDRPIKLDDHYMDALRYVLTWVCKYLGVS